MADITHPVQFSAENQKIIDSKKEKFSHHNWSDEDLQSVRKEIRDYYRIKQRGICSYCKQNVSVISASNCHIEHIVPKSLHVEFSFIPKNLCVICSDCNEIKRNQETLGEIPETMTRGKSRKRYPSSSGAFKIVHPHFDNYYDHIMILNGYYIDRGSKKGNFTIGACNLNRKLADFGWEPELVNEEELIKEMSAFMEEKNTLKRNRHLNNMRTFLFNL